MVPRSINGRILVGIVVCGLAVALAGGWYTDTLFQYYLDRELDHALNDKMRFLRAACLQTDEGVQLQGILPIWEKVQDPDDPEYFQLELSSGEQLLSSIAMQNAEFEVHWPQELTVGQEPVYRRIRLPSGAMGRAVWQAFLPSQEAGTTGEPIPVYLFAAHDRLRAEHALVKLNVFMLVGDVVAVALILGTVSIIVWMNLRPLRRLSKQIEAITVGEPESRFSLPSATSDLEPVVARLNDLMDRVTQSLEQERQFSSNVAHELRNPLAGIRSQIEADLNRERSAADYRITLRTILEVEQRLEAMVGNLLALNRLQSGRTPVDREPMDLSRVLLREWKTVFDVAETKQLDVVWEIAGDAAQLNSSPTLLSMVVRNLLDNAVSYAPAGTPIRIQLQRERDGGVATLRVSNANPGLSSEDCEDALRRFWRKSTSRHGEHVHSGLGLSLVTEVMGVLGGVFRFYISREGDEIRAEISLPRAD